MRLISLAIGCLATLASATVLQNGQVRENPYPGQAPEVTIAANSTWKSYPQDAPELSYKGRWDSQYISWWSAPGLKFGFTGPRVAIDFGPHTSPGTLVAYRLGGQDWQFSNVTADATYQFISAETTGFNLTKPESVRTFELRVQLAGVHTDKDGELVKLDDFPTTIEIIGDSLSAGQYGTYEGISSWAWNFGTGLGNVEFSITAYPGICVADKECWGNQHGQEYQWYKTSDTSSRAAKIYGNEPEIWDFSTKTPADLVVINLGTNDYNEANNVTGEDFTKSYISLIDGVHEVWPKAQIVIFALWNGFSPLGDSYYEQGAFVPEIYSIYQHFAQKAEYPESQYVHYFNTTGILQHNDIGPQWHPTDVGQIKLASHLQQYVKLKFGYEFWATGPEVQHGTLYWNDEPNY
ncbi:hypothetical protein FQN54_004174 [Arachnomyces sp. PD_36]|nr:hypothetical protein FQN54_004174 [Arachnomyces sp. PD_36]